MAGTVRLQKVLADSGIASRRKSEELIEQGKVRVNGRVAVIGDKVDPKNATEIEMFALTSYMDDKGLTDNTGMKSFNKMRAYSKQAEYNDFIRGIADSDMAWTQSRDWISILANARESYFRMPETYKQALGAESLIGSLMRWNSNSLLFA